MKTPEQIIDGLGGTSKVAKFLGLTPSVVSGWKTRGSIPRWRHGDIMKLAKKEGVEVIL